MDVRGALLALGEVLLERRALVVVERVERVPGRELVEPLLLHQPHSLAYLTATGDQKTNTACSHSADGRTGALVVVERVERVAGRELVELVLLHQPGSLAYLAATGDQSTEKPGLRSTARRNQRVASSRLPRQRSIIPRWKNSDASWVPRRRARFE